jgi:hypothetical protein
MRHWHEVLFCWRRRWRPVFTGNPEGEFIALTPKRAASFGAAKLARAIADRRFHIRSTDAGTWLLRPGRQQTIEGAQLSALFPARSFRAGSTLIAFALQ